MAGGSDAEEGGTKEETRMTYALWPEKLEVPCTEMGNMWGGADWEGHLRTSAIAYL